MPPRRSRSKSPSAKETKRPKSADRSSVKKGKGNKREDSSPDRKSKVRDPSSQSNSDKKIKPSESPSRRAEKNEKRVENVENVENEQKRPPQISQKLIKNAETLGKKVKLAEPDKKSVNSDKNLDKPTTPAAVKPKGAAKPIPPVIAANEKEKNKFVFTPKILKHKRDGSPVTDTRNTKSQRAICVNTDKHWYSVLETDIIEDPESSSREKPGSAPGDKKSASRSTLKRLMRRQLWNLSKPVIKGNEYWSNLMAENKIDVDKINIDAVDLSLIDVDALGIENRLLKSTVTWLLK